MPIKTKSIHILLAALLAMALASPAGAKDWRFFRMGDLKQGAELFTTVADVFHATHISVCTLPEAFKCMRMEGVTTLAVPRGMLPPSWEFEGRRYTLVERHFGVMLLGSKAEGAFIRAVGATGETTEFVYSGERGFFAFQWIPGQKEKPRAFISAQKCAPGADEHCRE
jgi:hypothetical protein